MRTTRASLTGGGHGGSSSGNLGKLKLSLRKGGSGVQAGVAGSYQSFLGNYDRDIDSDEDEIEFEEQFILRLPEGKPSEEMRELLKEKKSGTADKGKGKGKSKSVEDVWFKFKGAHASLLHSLSLGEEERERSPWTDPRLMRRVYPTRLATSRVQARGPDVRR